MIGALLAVACGALDFAAQDLSLLRVEDAEPVSGQVTLNALPCDMDNDGATDLFFREGVLFMRRGVYRDANLVALPEGAMGRDCQPHGRELYCVGGGWLVIYGWRGQWEELHRQEFEGPPALDRPEWTEEPRAARLGRFLHNVYGGETPEIVLASEEGLRVYAQGEDGAYHERIVAEVYPSLTLEPRGGRTLWPESARRRRWPPEQARTRLVIAGSTVLALTNQTAGERTHRYLWTRHRLDAEQSALGAGAQRGETPPMPFYVQACRLNDDEALDFAGSHWELSETAAVPAPVLETRVSTDGGATFQFFRHRGFSQPCSFADADGDGDLDFIAAETLLFHGGPRETLTRLLTATRAETQVRVYPQDAAGRFATRPSHRQRFTTELSGSLLRDPAAARRYQQGMHVDYSGDFNGDGRADLLVRSAPGRFEARLAGSDGRWGPVAAGIDAEDSAEAHCADVDQDGRDDLIVSWYERGRPWLGASRVYLSREEDR